MKVAELRAELRARGLRATGLKAELEERLEAALRDEAEEEEDDEDADEEDAGEEGEEAEEVVEHGSGIIAMPGQELVAVSMTVGTGAWGGFEDGAAAEAMFQSIFGTLLLADGRVLVADVNNHRIRMLSADLQQVSTVAGDGE